MRMRTGASPLALALGVAGLFAATTAFAGTLSLQGTCFGPCCLPECCSRADFHVCHDDPAVTEVTFHGPHGSSQVSYNPNSVTYSVSAFGIRIAPCPGYDWGSVTKCEHVCGICT
jgi:hypothetical protein